MEFKKCMLFHYYVHKFILWVQYTNIYYMSMKMKKKNKNTYFKYSVSNLVYHNVTI